MSVNNDFSHSHQVCLLFWEVLCRDSRFVEVLDEREVDEGVPKVVFHLLSVDVVQVPGEDP